VAVRLTLPDGSKFNTDGFIEPSLKQIYREKTLKFFQDYAGKVSINEFKTMFEAIKQEYRDLTDINKSLTSKPDTQELPQ